MAYDEDLPWHEQRLEFARFTIKIEQKNLKDNQVKRFVFNFNELHQK